MEIEDYLRKLEPAAPRAELRERVLAAAARTGMRKPIWPALASAAATLALLWAVNWWAERRLGALLERGVPVAHHRVPTGDPTALLFRLRKEIQ